MKLKTETTICEKQIKATVDKYIGDRVEKVIKNELGNFVEGHLAKKKLLGKTPPDMSDLIDRRLKLVVQRAVNAHTQRLNIYIAQALDSKVNAAVNRLVSKRATELRLKLLEGDTDAR